MKEMKDIIRKYVLQNALKFGKADPGRIIGKVFGERPELRENAKDVQLEIKKIVAEVNKLDKERIEAELKKIAPEMLEKKKEEKKDLPELKAAVMGKVVTRIPPEPSKYNHIGHALSFLINYKYAKKYSGKCILRFEDTNPLTSKQEYVDAMKEDVLEYLDIKPDKIVYVSDDMVQFYEYAVRLIEEGKAYVCFCDRDTMQENRHKGFECGCRKNSNEKNIKEWRAMLDSKYDEGECSLRLKIDMKNDNHVMRDPVIFRIVKAEHYRQASKYVVWPMYDFENAIEEHLCGVTHILRSSEFGTMRVELQEHIKKILGLKQQVAIQYGRFNVVGAITQGREIRALIEQGKVTGWDDPRLVTLKALKRRGILKETIHELVYEVGLSATQTNIDWKVISAINRRLLDPKAFRYFFVKDPVEITIEKAPEQSVELDLHPENRKGGRKFAAKGSFCISKDDFDSIKEGKLYRLMDCLNFKKSKKGFVFDSKEYEKFKDKGERIMHWLPAEQKSRLVEAEIMMEDGSWVKGLAEESARNIKPGEVVQFERFGFCRLDHLNDERVIFWFGHK